MNTFKLSNETELSVAEESKQDENILEVTFLGITNIYTLREHLTEENLSEISIYHDGGLSGFYEGYTNVSPYDVDGDNVTITFSKPGLLEQVENTQAQVTVLTGIIEALQDAIVMMI